MANTSKGRFPSYGLVRGPSHADGGVPASVANGPDVELEGGEYIIPKEAVPDYLPVLQQITQVGRDRQQMQNGNTAIDALIASASMQNGIAQPKSPVYQEGGRVSFLERLPLIGNQLRGYREFQEAEDFINRQNPDSPLFSEEVQQRGIQVGGELKNVKKSENDITVTDLLQSAMYNYDPQELSRGIASFGKSDQGKSVLNKLIIGRPEGYTIEEDDGRASRFVGRENIAQSERGKKLLGLFPVGYSGSVEPNTEGNYQLDFSDLDALKALAGYQKGGMIQYEDGGEVHSRRMYNQGTGFDKKKSDLDGDGEISEYERKRGMAIAKAMGKMQMGGMVGMQRPMNPAMNFSPMQRMNPRMYQEGGQVDKGAYPAKDMEMLKQFPLTYKFFMDRRGRQSYYPEQDSLAARMFRGEIDPNEAFSKALMLPLTQEKGTAPPRRQQEIRNPNERFGPPDSLAYSVKDLEKQAQENFESFMDSLEYRRSLNPFTGKPMDTDADLERLRKRMIQSRIPPSKQRMPMQEGGQIPSARSMRPSVEAQERLLRDLQERGLVGTNPADTPGFFPLASQAQPGSLIEAISSDRRVMPLEMQSDRYMTEIPNAKNYQSYEMQPPVYSKEVTVVPKLSTAYLASFGVETPLSKRQQELLLRKGVAPKTLNPSVKGLINRVLVQRLGNENN